MDDLNDIPAEKFRFAARADMSHDKKPETKPVGYLRDAWRRFCKNKSSIAGMAIIALLILFALIVPFVSRYGTTYTDGYYNKVLPKISARASGIWDGTQRAQDGAATYQYRRAIGVESGRQAVVKTYGVSGEGNSAVYSYRVDTYNVVGYVFKDLTQEEYFALQDYQDETGRQVLYPMQITTSQGANKVMYNVNDANYWYKTYLTGENKGQAVFDGDGNFINIYRTSGTDNYYSKMRIAGDAGIEDESSPDRYRYAQTNQSGYRVRVCYYDYYVYLHGFEPVFIFGTNAAGQDLFVCAASGTRFSLILALGVSAINLILGAIYGAVEGFYGGKTDLIMERIADILSGIPFMVVAVLFNLHLSKTVGAAGALIFAFVLTGWIGTAATVRMQFYRYKKQEYVLAARTLGARDRRLIIKHVFPNALGTVITAAALYVPSVIFSETSLAYLGIVNLDDPSSGLTSLGALLSAGQSAMTSGYPHIILFPALIISLLMISFNLFGNGLRDAFNPNLRGSEG